MKGRQNQQHLDRRQFFTQSWQWACAGWLAAPLAPWMFAATAEWRPLAAVTPTYFGERLAPHYRQPGQLEEVLRHAEPGSDEFVTEKYAAEIEALLAAWGAELRQSSAGLTALEPSLAPALRASTLRPVFSRSLRPLPGLEVYRNQFAADLSLDKERFRTELREFTGFFRRVNTTEFAVTAISESSDAAIRTRVRYDLVGSGADFFRAQRTGYWEIEWEPDSRRAWRARTWRALGETLSRATSRVFVDVASQALGACASYHRQLLPGIDYWRTVLDGASRIDVYGNNGIAAGDFDGDGFDDLYICQPAGLPNRLFRNRRDGTFEDVTEQAGVGVLDNSPCALFADLRNSGRQDLLVVTVDGPLLFLNHGHGRFEYRPDAFQFAQPPLGTFTAAALADYDGDGFLDVYFCLYSYYLGLNQYQYPTPYYDASNGPPNFLMHNRGDGTFTDATAASGMNANNNRYSFACAWCDFDGDGHPDLYVANDFGRKNLYHNNGHGTFTDVAREAGVEDVGAGMSVCWFDYDNDGRQDLYVADMWSAAGLRVSAQDQFASQAPAEIRAMLRKHAGGNSLFHNQGDGRFADQSVHAGVEMGRWSWSSDAWDFDHDGYPDLYIANGMISGPKGPDLSSFFWRQVVAATPLKAAPSHRYQRGWNAINELIRSDGTWSGYERNNFYANNRDGTFSDISGTAGLDFGDDSRAFALTDLDHDGRLEVVLKNRSGPQLRILHNEMNGLAPSIAFRLRGRQTNRDAIGACVTVERGGQRQTKFVQAGSGFLSQHTKDLHFGLGEPQGLIRATVRWPSGQVQAFEHLPANHLILIEEGVPEFRAEPFRPFRPSTQGEAPAAAPPPEIAETWLLVPVPAPTFTAPDVAGQLRKLEEFHGRPLLLNFWKKGVAAAEQDLKLLHQLDARWSAQGLSVASVNVNGPNEAEAVRALVRSQAYAFPILLATEEVTAVYNIVFRYLFDRRRDLGIPTSFLLDAQGMIVKVYQGPLEGRSVEADFRRIPQTSTQRVAAGLPFPGTLYGGEFHRNYFTYALVLLDRGYPEQAESFCWLVLEREPENAEAHYLLGMIYLQQQRSKEARASFERTLRARPTQPDTFANAWNNLGMLAAQEGRSNEAISAFQEAIRLNPGYTIALENLGNVYRQLHRWAEAQSVLEQALKTDPQDAGVNYSLAMTFAQQDDTARAETYFHAALKARPDYPEALNNLGVLYLRTHRVEEGVQAFQTCVRVAPGFDQAYINLAKVYALQGRRNEAAATLHQLLQQHPDHELAKQLLAELGDQN